MDYNAEGSSSMPLKTKKSKETPIECKYLFENLNIKKSCRGLRPAAKKGPWQYSKNLKKLRWISKDPIEERDKRLIGLKIRE